MKKQLTPDEPRWLRADRETHAKIARVAFERSIAGNKTTIKDLLRRLIVEEKNWKDI